MTRTRQPTAALVRSSAAEYLTFVAASGRGGVEADYADENAWLSQKMVAQIDVRTINDHLKTVFSNSELEEDPASSESCRRRQEFRHEALPPRETP